MAKARFAILISLSLSLLLSGTAAHAAASDAQEDQPRGTAFASATTYARPSHEHARGAAKPDASRRAAKPQYVRGGWQCPPGFVWRNAGRTDWLCVDPQEALRIDRENQEAAANWVDGPDGAPVCRSGLVKREAFKSDIVCVDPLRRDATRQMNLALFSVR